MVKSIFQFRACHIFLVLILSVFLLLSGVEEAFAVPVIGLDPNTGQRGLQEKEEAAEDSPFDVPDMPESYARNVFALKYTDRDAYYQVVESMGDYEYAMYAGFEAMFERQMTPTELAIAEELTHPATEGLGEEYLMEAYDIAPEDIGSEDFAQYMFELQETDADRYWDIIANMTDEQYEEYYGTHEYFEENHLYVSSNTMTAFLLENGMFKTGNEIVLDVEDGAIVVPEDMMFLIQPSDGEEYYVYGSSPSVIKIAHGTDSIDFIYTDAYGVRITETLYTENGERAFVFETEPASENTSFVKERGDSFETK